MSPTLEPGNKEYIIRTSDGRILGLPFVIQPGIVVVPIPVPTVALPEGLLPQRFQVEHLGGDTYRVGDAVDFRNRLFSYREVEPEKWIIIHRPNHDLYTIEKEDSSAVWVAPPVGQTDCQILVQQVPVGPSDPPTYPSNALFRFEPVAAA
ncbi:hypothetical protein EDD15DRAFT_2230482 [Pisolithus albus]|nr:hypothetical protein EDD15DRAFT_2230482 [Pisolithus albus]